MSFETFYHDHYSRALRYTKKKINSSQDAEDLVSNAFLYCYEHFSDYDPEKAPAGAWLFMVLNSRIKNYYRDRKETSNLDDLSEFISSDEDYIKQGAELQELRNFLATALETLKPIEQKIIIQKYFYDRTSIQIAEETGIGSAHIRVMTQRALTKLEKYCVSHGWGKE